MKDNPYLRPILLLICKNPVKRAWLCKHLDESFEIIVEINPQKALTAAGYIHLDFILIDSEIIKDNLLAYCHQIRIATLSDATLLYLVTGRLSKSFQDQAKKQGITDFIHSQLHEDELRDKMRQGMEQLKKKKKAKKVFSHVDLTTLVPPETKKSLAYKAIVSFAKAKDEERPSSIVMIKVSDYAKLSQSQKNDVKRVLESNIDQEDILIPTKEGHYVVVLPKTKETKAKNLALEIQSKCAHLPKSIDVSIALSEFSATKQDVKGKQFQKMMDVANKTLNELKRNQIKTFKIS